VGRVNLDDLKKETEVRDRDYIWKKDLVIDGRVIKASKPKSNKEKEA